MDSWRGEGSEGRQRVQLHVTGLVQGVGFRPFVYRTAEQLGLGGYVHNRKGDVIIEAEGSSEQIRAFMAQLKCSAELPIRVDHIEVSHLSLLHDTIFRIEPSTEDGAAEGGFPADLAVCLNCIEDIHQAHSNYYKYPFTSCTSCGPRYSILRKLPYDRQHTALSSFPLCQSCQSEYEDPSNRRFHAQTLNCPDCGPAIAYRSPSVTLYSENALLASQQAIREGSILAVKGVGGFHLICDASQEQTIEQLRARKRRPRKPLALMARDLAEIEALFVVTAAQRQALMSPEAPIVLLTPRAHASQALPLSVIAPGLTRIGVFLPYTPLHHLLFLEGPNWLVATSGNVSGHPIIYRNEEAIAKLQGIADALLVHTRDIEVPIDDSVGFVVDEEFHLIRRARGYTPLPLRIPLPPALSRLPVQRLPAVMGAGSELKSTFCLIHNGAAYVSQHLGDMDSKEALTSYWKANEHMRQLFNVHPEILAYDPHPGYAISKEVLKGEYVTAYPIFHHHAHMAACMAENGLDTPVIGCILDGSGYGEDGTSWGFEVLTGDFTSFRRERSLCPIVLPGGEAAIRHPWLVGAGLIYESALDLHAAEHSISERFSQYRGHFPILSAQLAGRLPSMRVSSAGRLFDGVSAILGLCTENSYEGEAALRLSELADTFVHEAGNGEELFGSYPFELAGECWNTTPMIRAILQDLDDGLPTIVIANKFHSTVAEMVTEGVRAASSITGIRQVVLSGGVWQNRYLLYDVKRRLQRDGYSIYTHRMLPSGDGGISYGQAVCGLWRWAKEHVLVGTSESH